MPNSKHYLDVVDRVLYVLELEDGCFYVVQALKGSLERRMTEHFDTGRKSRKSPWVRAHKALRVIEVVDCLSSTAPEVEVLENQKTLDYMREYGIDKVRGGNFCRTDLCEIVKCIKAHGIAVQDNMLK